jgi:hypothetical protein
VDELESITKDLFGRVHWIIAKEMKLSQRSSKAKDKAKLHQDIKTKRKSEEQQVLEVSMARGVSRAIATVKVAHTAMSNLIRLWKTSKEMTSNQITELKEQCQRAERLVKVAMEEVSQDVKEFKENIGAVQQY